MPEILFSNLNLAPKDIFLASSAELADKATDLGYDGIEFTTVYSRAMRDFKNGKDLAALAALHESFPFSTELDIKRWKSIAKNLGFACLMPPSTTNGAVCSADHMNEIQQAHLEPLPVVAYPHRRGDEEADLAKRDLFYEVSFQPSAEVMEMWGTTDGLDFLAAAKRRQFTICVDTFHAIRRSRRTGKPPIHWSGWLPYAAAQDSISRMHLSGYRNDFAAADPEAVEQNNRELDVLLSEQRLTGELKDMAAAIKAFGANVTAITLELPRSGVARALVRRGFTPNQANIDGVFIDAADAARKLFD